MIGCLNSSSSCMMYVCYRRCCSGGRTDCSSRRLNNVGVVVGKVCHSLLVCSGMGWLWGCWVAFWCSLPVLVALM